MSSLEPRFWILVTALENNPEWKARVQGYSLGRWWTQLYQCIYWDASTADPVTITLSVPHRGVVSIGSKFVTLARLLNLVLSAMLVPWTICLPLPITDGPHASISLSCHTQAIDNSMYSCQDYSSLHYNWYCIYSKYWLHCRVVTLVADKLMRPWLSAVS